MAHRAHGLGVMTAPLQGADRRFNSGWAHQVSIIKSDSTYRTHFFECNLLYIVYGIYMDDTSNHDIIRTVWKTTSSFQTVREVSLFNICA